MRHGYWRIGTTAVLVHAGFVQRKAIGFGTSGGSRQALYLSALHHNRIAQAKPLRRSI